MKQADLKLAYFAGGCFWCMESDFHNIPGIVNVISGYMGGHLANPSYNQVCSGRTGHAEAIKIIYDPKIISYADLLKIYWLNIDPTVLNQQFCDTGTQYRTAIFYSHINDIKFIDDSLMWLKENYPNIKPVTEIVPATEFFPAEQYHQNYCKTNAQAYQSYRDSCGRDATLRRLYGDEREKLLRSVFNRPSMSI